VIVSKYAGLRLTIILSLYSKKIEYNVEMTGIILRINLKTLRLRSVWHSFFGSIDSFYYIHNQSTTMSCWAESKHKTINFKPC